MITLLKKSLLLTFMLLVLLAGMYPLFIVGVAYVAGSNHGKGDIILRNGKIVGFANVAQGFASDRYFSSRPSAFGYDATGGSYGSNAGPANPGYLATVRARIDTFMRHNPEISRRQIPSELVTASGSGLDPHLSPEAAHVQIPRIAKARGLGRARVKALVDAHVQGPLLGIMGPRTVNVLKLNLALDLLK